MSRRRAPVVLVMALLGCPACLDPIVGGECKTGFSPCHGICLPSGTCQVLDASSEATVIIDGPENGTGIDASDLDGDDIDAGTPDDGGIEEEAGLVPIDASLDESRVDGGEYETHKDADAASTPPEFVDSSPRRDAADINDVVDAPLPDDLPPPDDLAPILVKTDADIDADRDGDLDVENGDGACPGCLDGESVADTEPADGGASADDSAASDDTSMNDALQDDSGPDGPLVCTDPQMLCNDQCVDPTLDPENCGDCNNICATGVCLDGGCLVCDSDESVCGRQCINLSTDPDNCGGCGVPCASGLCSNGRCEAAGTGRAIVIGHDYYKNRPAMNRILGNAVFLWPVNPVRLLEYRGNADPIAINGANAAIQQVATATGRQPAVTVANTAAEVPGALASADVLLVYGQAQADDGKLAQWGHDWASAFSYRPAAR